MKVPTLRFSGFTEEWKLVSFKSLFSEVNEKTGDTDKYPLFSLTINEGVTQKTDRYNREFLVKKEDNYKIMKPQYFVYNPMNMTIGALAQYKGAKEISVSGYYNVFKNKSNYKNQFLEDLLKTPKMINTYKRIATGSLIEKQRVHFSQFIELKALLPSIEEANRISDFMETLTKKIQLQQEKVNLLKEQKKGLIQKLFSRKLRFKDEGGGGYPEWQQYILDNIVTFYKGQVLSKEDLTNDGESCVLYGQLYTTYNEIIDCVFSKTKNLNGFKGEIGDVLIPSSGESSLDIACASALNVEAYLGGDLNVLRPNKNVVSGNYLAYLLSHVYKYELSRLAQGASVVHLYSREIKSLKIELPSLDEQNKISNFLIKIDKKINKEKSKILYLDRQKQAFMQQMFI